MDIGNKNVVPIVTYHKVDGFTVNGRKVPADANGNPLNPHNKIGGSDSKRNKNDNDGKKIQRQAEGKFSNFGNQGASSVGTGSSQGPTKVVTYYKNDGLVANGRKGPADANGNLLNPHNKIGGSDTKRKKNDYDGKKIQRQAEGKFSNFGNQGASSIGTGSSQGPKKDNYGKSQQPVVYYKNILYKGLNNVHNNRYTDSPSICLYEHGVIIDGKKIPMDIGNKNVVPVVTYHKVDGFTVNGRKVPADANGNPINPQNKIGGSDSKRKKNDNDGKKIQKQAEGKFSNFGNQGHSSVGTGSSQGPTKGTTGSTRTGTVGYQFRKEDFGIASDEENYVISGSNMCNVNCDNSNTNNVNCGYNYSNNENCGDNSDEDTESDTEYDTESDNESDDDPNTANYTTGTTGSTYTGTVGSRNWLRWW
ncbi:probable serine/threonine-protein kinase clkA [Adelges cooleyi]|uniref:probable serine/threonine-protein kinase clkA n=1 Tax=Adelges cooleyi TaxID=133065 RepID=UPI0021805C30|nr:probable serine/threonine-protein kinase clkA [Adelges cooleyi]